MFLVLLFLMMGFLVGATIIRPHFLGLLFLIQEEVTQVVLLAIPGELIQVDGLRFLAHLLLFPPNLMCANAFFAFYRRPPRAGAPPPG